MPVWRSPELAEAIWRVIEHEATKPDERQSERRSYLESQGSRYSPPADAGRATGVNVPGAEPPNVPGAKPPADRALLGWIDHIAWVAGLVDAGWSPRLNDLRLEEWEGLRLWRAAQARLQGEYAGCPGCGRAIRRNAKMHGCGWRAE